jgi:hypothetical protein
MSWTGTKVGELEKLAVTQDEGVLFAEMTDVTGVARDQPRLSDELERWLRTDPDKTLGSLVDVFEERGFAILFVFLLGVPALPLPTGGVTHVSELIAMLLALQLIANRDCVWLPRRWRAIELAGEGHERFITGLMKTVRRLERVSRPRLTVLFEHRVSNTVFGVLVIGGSLGAFLAVPFTGLDTLPALGVVVLSLGVLLEDFALVAGGTLVGAVGVALEILLGKALVDAIGGLF